MTVSIGDPFKAGSSADAALDYIQTGCQSVPHGLTNYYGLGNGEDEPRAQWAGLAAARLGLHGPVERSDFAALWDRLDPRTGEPLTKFRAQSPRPKATPESIRELLDLDTAKALPYRLPSLTPAEAATIRDHLLAGDRRGVALALTSARRDRDAALRTSRSRAGSHAIDFGTAPPKSVSLVALLHDDESVRNAIQIAHHQADADMVAWAQANVFASKTNRSNSKVKTTAEWVMADSTHSTSRPSTATLASGVPPDPQLHTHHLLLSVAWDPGRQKWITLEFGTLTYVRGLMGAAYDAALARRLQAAGIELAFADNGRWEVAGVNRRLCTHFSSRTGEIEAEKKARNIVSPLAARDITLQTRHAKCDDSMTDFAPRWREVASGFSASALRSIDSIRPRDTCLPLSNPHDLLERFFDLGGMTHDHATTSRTDARARLLVLSRGRFSLDELDAVWSRALTDQRMIFIAADESLTTTTIRDLEAGWMVVLDRLAASSWETPTRDQLDRAIASSPVPLSPEQVAAVENITAGNALAVLDGAAGSGKTTTAAALVSLGRATDRQTIVLAVAKNTAIETAAAIGADSGISFEAFHRRVDKRQLNPAGAVIVVDEAAMVDLKRLGMLLAHVGQSKVVFIGDPRQLTSIGPGGGWDLAIAAVRNAGRDVATLVDVKRQKVPWQREAGIAAGKGDTVEALAAYMAHGRVISVDDHHDAIETAVDVWDRSRLQGAEQGIDVDQFRLLVTSTNRDKWTANDGCQRRLRASGDISGLPVNVRDEVAGRDFNLYVGDRVVTSAQVFISKAERVDNGTRGTIIDVDHARKTVQIEWDTPAHGISTVRPEAWPQGKVEETSGRVACPIELAYGRHKFKGQGGTWNSTTVLASGHVDDSNSLHNALTRHTEDCHIVIDRSSLRGDITTDLEAAASLAASTAVSRRQISATAAIADPQLVTPRARNQAAKAVKARAAIAEHLAAIRHLVNTTEVPEPTVPREVAGSRNDLAAAIAPPSLPTPNAPTPPHPKLPRFAIVDRAKPLRASFVLPLHGVRATPLTPLPAPPPQRDHDRDRLRQRRDDARRRDDERRRHDTRRDIA